MPLYEYECGACAHRFEIIQRFSDAPVMECPKCRGALRKLQSAPAFQLKGTGWYATDYPKAGQTPPDADSGGSTDSASGDTAATKGDTSEKTEKSDKADKAGKTEKAASADSSASATPSKTTTKDKSRGSSNKSQG